MNARVENRHTRSRSSCILHLPKVVDVRVVALESQHERVSREDVPVGRQLVEEGKLVALGSNLRRGVQ